MKGESEVTEVLTIIGLVAVLIAIVPLIITIFKKHIESYALSSPEVVSRELASLISTISSSPYNASLEYNTGNKYNVYIDEKMVKVSKDGDEKEVSSPILINARGNFYEETDFLIEKKIIKNCVNYYINGRLIFHEGCLI